MESSAERIVYQSAGIGRDAAGNVVTLGGYAVQELDLRTGEVREVASAPEHDLLGPRMSADGTLYCIRRPRRETKARSFLGAVTDVLLFPWRLLVAVFHYLNFFSARYTGKPLTTAGGPRRDGPDVGQMMIWGNLLRAQDAARGAADRGGEPPPLAPRSWQLERRRPGAEPEQLAEHVLASDVGPAGQIVYSTGSAVYGISPSGERTRLAAAAGIERVVLLRQAANSAALTPRT